MYKCMHCGHDFEKPKITHNGGYWEEEWAECPNCGSEDYEEYENCLECGAQKIPEALTHGFCKDCIETMEDEFQLVYDYGEQERAMVAGNGIFDYAFSADEINLALMYWLMNKRDPKKEARRFAKKNENDFTYFLKERKENGKSNSASH